MLFEYGDIFEGVLMLVDGFGVGNDEFKFGYGGICWIIICIVVSKF